MLKEQIFPTQLEYRTIISSEGGITRIFSEAKTMGKEGRAIIEEYISEQVYSRQLE